VSSSTTTYPPQQQLWQQDRRRFLLALGAILALLLIVSLITLIVTRPTPDKTLDTFCNALVAGDGRLAVSQLSTNLQNQQGAILITVLSARPITMCAHTPATIKGSSATATLLITSSSQTGPNNQSKTLATLIQDASGAWKIDALQSGQGEGKPGRPGSYPIRYMQPAS
jgi:hypothetical protein